ncbi:Hpt domain-containing protein [Endozoicomonas atrinae]|uniref:Hpt domain-containing protein n=1 Tax=Endozoicomonas atrinae TaxID=1333660 RepID=UPI000825E475|nr:Hpt domain-containing protein [Endozoicomonas atrinae]
MGNVEEYNQMLADIRQDYLNKLKTISDRMKMLYQDPSLCFNDSQAFSEIYIIAHNLHGSADTFGFKPVSEAAAPLDFLLEDIRQCSKGRVIGEESLLSLRSMIAELIVSVNDSLIEADG